MHVLKQLKRKTLDDATYQIQGSYRQVCVKFEDFSRTLKIFPTVFQDYKFTKIFFLKIFYQEHLFSKGQGQTLQPKISDLNTDLNIRCFGKNKDIGFRKLV